MLIMRTAVCRSFGGGGSTVIRKASESPKEELVQDVRTRKGTEISISQAPGGELASEVVPLAVTSKYTPDQTKAIGNLVADDEWMGLTMEIVELVRVAVLEDVKGNAREFLGKDNYEAGDISRELDRRVKEEVARLRGKDEYEVRQRIASRRRWKLLWCARARARRRSP